MMNGRMDDMMGWMGLGMAVWMVLGLALLVFVVVALVRLWPRRGEFRSSKPPRDPDDDA